MNLEQIKARCIEEGECWIWQQGTGSNGRPQMRHQGKSVYVRRLARELADGKPVPSTHEVPCACGNRLCVSPHCSTVATAKGRARLAKANNAYSNASRIAKMTATIRAKAKYSEEVVEQARTMDGTSREIALALGMSRSHAKAIRAGRSRARGAHFGAWLL